MADTINVVERQVKSATLKQQNNTNKIITQFKSTNEAQTSTTESNNWIIIETGFNEISNELKKHQNTNRVTFDKALKTTTFKEDNNNNYNNYKYSIQNRLNQQQTVNNSIQYKNKTKSERTDTTYIN